MITADFEELDLRFNVSDIYFIQFVDIIRRGSGYVVMDQYNAANMTKRRTIKL